MPNIFFTKKNIVGLCVIALVVLFVGLFFFNLRAPAESDGQTIIFQINPGDGFRTIASNLHSQGVIRSPLAFEFFALIEGDALTIKPGLYRLSTDMDAAQVLAQVSGSGAGEVLVTIPPGSNMYDIDRILSNALVTPPGAIIKAATSQKLEGYLFPDTYEFYTNSNAQDVITELKDNFNDKAASLLNADPANKTRNLIIASILEKEVPDQADQELVAGIILKRISLGMPLDIDATVCYAKLLASTSSPAATAAQACQLTALDFKIQSPYNTYLYKGLPPGPIGNPDASAITAALHPESSSYLYYLSDPKTGQTIFAKTLDEQNQNRVKYLESNQ